MASDNSIDIDWIDNFLELIPKTAPERKDYIAIAGYPSWENVNSNLLSFYFDENEEHQFSRLFIDSLLDTYCEKFNTIKIDRGVFESDFSVDREVSTENGKRIDILIKDLNCIVPNPDNKYNHFTNNSKSNWSIIIENKISADLNNDLEDYWNSVDSEHKVGIVLSIKPTKIPETHDNFKNILHKDLIRMIIRNLSDFYEQSDDRHLLLLKEYILNINTHYKDTKQMDKTLRMFHSKQEKIRELIETDTKLLKYVSNTVFQVMSKNNFPPSSRRITPTGKHFYSEEDREFRFWVNFDKLKYENHFIAHFELWGKENTIHGDRLKEILQMEVYLPKYVQHGTGGNSGSAFQHIYQINIPVGDFSDEGLEETISNLLQEYVFGENTYIDTAIEEYAIITGDA